MLDYQLKICYIFTVVRIGYFYFENNLSGNELCELAMSDSDNQGKLPLFV